jgi:2-dehydropantoate 2-reductase
MEVLIYGAGAVGGYFGGRLLEQDVPVTFLARGPQLLALREHGIRLDSIDGDFSAPVHTARNLSQALKGPTPDLVLLCVKGHDTAAAASDMAAHLPVGTPVMALQNGIDHLNELGSRLGPSQIIAATVFIGAQVSEPGVIRHTGAGFIRAGYIPSGAGLEQDALGAAKAKAVITFMADHGINITASPDILLDMWKKLLWNVGFNGPSALCQATVGQLTERQGSAWLIRGLIAEAVAVGQRAGIDLSNDLVEKTFGHIKGLDDFKTSMLQDVEAGRPIENSAFYGYLLTEAARLNIDTPLIRMTHDALALRFG